MLFEPNHIARLIYRSFSGTIDEQERTALDAWLDEVPMRRAWFGQLDGSDDFTVLLQSRPPDLVTDLRSSIHEKIRVETGITMLLDNDPANSTPPVHRVHFLKTAWFRYAAAIILLFGIGAYLWNNYNTKPLSTTATIEPSSSDILPGGQKAKLTLADGREIILDSAANGQIAVENGSEVIKRGGEIIYDAGQYHREAVVYNTMSTPKGGQYQLTLPDGTKVWLNAASQITYPTRFTGKTREVKVEGEVYFEIKRNKNQPFIVKTSSDEIKVLGTEFNVNNYPDEPQSKISLINGAVKVNNQLLQPGQAFSNGKIMQTNIEQDIAWRRGLFNFENASLAEVMRQLERWYDIEVIYQKGIPDIHFGGKMSRNMNLNQVLKALEMSKVHFRLKNDKQLIVFE